MSFNFRDITPVLSGDSLIEVSNGAGPSTLVKPQLVEVYQYFAAGVPSPTSQVVFIAPPIASVATGATPLGNYRLVGVSATFTTASTSGTLQITHDTGVSAPGSGTALLGSTVSLSGTANTVVSGVPSASVSLANQTISPGDRLSLVFAGTLTNLVNLSVSLYVARV